MASSVATPLERQFGRIAAVSEMTSSSSLGSTSVTLQFNLDRNIDAAARDVQAAINAARGYLPTNLPNNPTYRKVNPADSPILILGADLRHSLQKPDLRLCLHHHGPETFAGERGGPGIRGGRRAARGARGTEPHPAQKYGIGLEQVRGVLSNANANTPKGHFSDGHQHRGKWAPTTNSSTPWTTGR